MKKVVLIVGICSFILFLGMTLLFPVCTVCLALFAGAAAGWLAAYWTELWDEGHAAALGAQAGALSGIGALLGQAVGGMLNAVLVGPEDAMMLFENLGITGMDTVSQNSTAYYLGAVGGQFCCGLVNIGLMAALGALAAYIYYKISNRNRPPQTEYYA